MVLKYTKPSCDGFVKCQAIARQLRRRDHANRLPIISKSYFLVYLWYI
jgi:hypothetical protein